MQQKAQRELQTLQLQQTSQTTVTKQLSNVQSNQQQQQQEGLPRQVSIKKTNAQQQDQPVDVLGQTNDVKTSVGQILSRIDLPTRRKPSGGTIAGNSVR